MADKKEPPGKLSGRDEYGESGEGFEYKEWRRFRIQIPYPGLFYTLSKS